MRRRTGLRSTRGGLALDLVVAAGLVLIAAFALASIGVTWAELVHGVTRFFGA